MIANQAGTGEGDPQSQHRCLDQQPGLAETLTTVANRLVPADPIEPALPIRTTAVALSRRIVKQRQVEECLDCRHLAALSDKAGAAYRKHAIWHQFHHGVARIGAA